MRDRKRLKMNLEVFVNGVIVKIPSIPVERNITLSDFITEQYNIIVNQLKYYPLTFDILTVELKRIAIIDSNEIHMYVEDETMEEFKLGGIRKLRFSGFKTEANIFIAEEKETEDDIDFLEDLIEEYYSSNQ